MFVRTELADGRLRSGLKVLRTDVARLHLLLGARLLRRYAAELVSVDWDRDGDSDHVRTRSRWRGAHLDVRTADDDPPAPPPGSPFASWDEAAPFSGPLPWTLAPDRDGAAAVAVKGVRSGWRPRPVTVTDQVAGFFERPPFAGTTPRLAAAFRVDDVAYTWQAGTVEAVTAPSGGRS